MITREVPRPAITARYFGTFNAVDIHDQRRQSELGLESKWVAKGDNAGKFRLATTIFGMAVVDTQRRSLAFRFILDLGIALAREFP